MFIERVRVSSKFLIQIEKKVMELLKIQVRDSAKCS